MRKLFFVIGFIWIGFATNGQNHNEPFYGAYSNGQIGYTGFYWRILTLKTDSFWFKMPGSYSDITVKGKYIIKGDSIKLYKNENNLYAVFVSDSIKEFLSLAFIDGNIAKPEERPYKLLLQREESYYQDGKIKAWKRIFSARPYTGVFYKYELYMYDEQGNIISKTRIENGLNNGLADTFMNVPMGTGYVTRDNGTLAQTKNYYFLIKHLGRWKKGRKVGKWKYYDKDGRLSKTEYYSYKRGLIR